MAKRERPSRSSRRFSHEPAKRRTPRANLPLATPAAQRALFEILADPAHMLEVLQRELPRLAEVPVRVMRCKAKVHRSRAALRAGRIRIVYKVRIALEQDERELVLLGTAPETAEFLEEAPCRALRGHVALAPFAEPALHVAELQLALRIYPLDPKLPALAEIEGGGATELLARHLVARGLESPIERVERELRHYKPFKRAVLRCRTVCAGGHAPREFYVKLFADERGAEYHREQVALFEATRGARALRIPEPLGYDPERRMLLMDEASGPARLIDWIKCLENHRSLPRGVDLARVERCLAVAAHALAELQSCGVRPRARRGYRQELASLAKDRCLLRGELSKRHPVLTRRAEGLLARLETLAPAREELVPAHGGFRHKQTVGDEHSLTVIDWDGLCLADAALDAATFLLRLRQEPLREPGGAAEMQALADGFRREFLARVPRVTPARLALYEGFALTQGMLRSFRRAVKDEAMERTIANMAAAAAEALDRAGRDRVRRARRA